MMAALRSWVLGVTYASMILAVAESLVPVGSAKRMLHFCGGLALILVVLMPLLELNQGSISDYISGFEQQIEGYEEQMEEESSAQMEALVAQESERYIVEQAQQLGIDCTAEVYCATSADGYPIPFVVHISASITAQQQEALSALIAEQLDIPIQQQYYNERGGDEDEAD